MRRAPATKGFKPIRAALMLFAVLLVIYIPLKIYLAVSDQPPVASGTTISVFVTTDLAGYREPCG